MGCKYTFIFYIASTFGSSIVDADASIFIYLWCHSTLLIVYTLLVLLFIVADMYMEGYMKELKGKHQQALQSLRDILQADKDGKLQVI